MKDSFGKGAFFAVSAYLMWGILPLYWKLLSAINSMHILAFRISFSLVGVAVILLAQKNLAWLKILRDRKKAVLLLVTALTISFNWGLYIWAVNQGHTIETSLGYYINPLISIVFGLAFFREKLRPIQWCAFFLAVAGVILQTVFTGALPWISIFLALSFGFYGLLKKTVTLSALDSLGTETLLSIPVCLVLLFFPFSPSPLFPQGQGLSYMAQLPFYTVIALLLCGAATTLPLYAFAKGVKLLPLSALGFFQFISPTLTFLEGIFVFHEPFPLKNLAVFGCIWTALILYVISLKTHEKPVENRAE
jgi:chloramphenicol-sensitive protein RarD